LAVKKKIRKIYRPRRIYSNPAGRFDKEISDGQNHWIDNSGVDMQLAMIDDKILPLKDLEPAYQDRGLWFGDGVYEVIRSYNGKLFAFEDHMNRFSYSLAQIGLTGVSIEQIRGRVLKAYEASKIGNVRIYFHVTRGSEPRNHLPGKNLRPNFLLTLNELVDHPEDKEKGVSVSTYPDWRWKRCDIKSLNLLPNIMARMDAEKKGCYEAIFVNDAREITEGAGSAYFAIDGEKKELITRPLGNEILPSITRKQVLKIVEGTGLKVVQQAISPDQAKSCSEMFLAVTTKDILPVVQFDGARIGTGRVGEWTKVLIEKFVKLTETGYSL
jgi:D-alanine transaminase